MRIDGDIKILQDIEQYIKAKTKYDLVKNGDSEPICPVSVPKSLHVKIYRIYVIPYEFDVKLVFDERNNRGGFSIPDRNSQLLFVNHPKIGKMLSEMGTLLMREYSHGKGKTDALVFNEKAKSKLSDFTAKVKEKLNTEYFT